MTVVTVCSDEQLRKDKRAIAEIDGTKIALFFNGDRYFAVKNMCPHTGAPLFWGTLGGTLLPSKPGEYTYGKEGLILECPWHRREFDLETGCVLSDPRMRVKMYPVSVEAGEVRIDFS